MYHYSITKVRGYNNTNEAVELLVYHELPRKIGVLNALPISS
jgi:hypothetical protein